MSTKNAMVETHFRNVYNFRDAPEVRHDGHKVVVLNTFAPEEREPDILMHECACECGDTFEAFTEEIERT